MAYFLGYGWAVVRRSKTGQKGWRTHTDWVGPTPAAARHNYVACQPNGDITWNSEQNKHPELRVARIALVEE